ncbi:MAG: GGDEF domain-containing protein [Candidatus Cloacimonetes bacterium]|nr:GGDEF domain-containing protein [Candidatus Cloacimonadota bacterium]
MKYLLLISILFVSIFLFSNNVKMIELDNSLSSLSGVKKIETLLELSDISKKIDKNKSLKYSEQALNLSSEINNSKYEAESFYKIGIIYYELDKHELAISNLQNAYNKYVKNKQIGESAKSQNMLGIVYFSKGNNVKALAYYKKALATFTDINDKENITEVFSNLGSIHYKLNKYEDALDFFQKSLTLKKELQDSLGIASTLNDIGSIYKQLNNFDEALSNFHLALAIFEKQNYQKGVADCYNNIGYAYVGKKNNDKALEYFIRSSNIREKMNNFSGLATCLNSIGNIYFNKKNNTLASKYYKNSLEKYKLLNNQYGIALVTSNLAKIDYHLKKYKLAIKKVNESLIIAEKDNMRTIIQEDYKILSDIYAKINDFDKALMYFKMYTEIKETFFNEELQKISSMKQNLNFNNDNSAELESQKTRNYWKILLIVLFFLIILLIAIIERIWSNHRVKKNVKKHEQQLESLIKTDNLTKISNKKDIIDRMEMEKKRYARNQKSFVAIFADLDEFKRLNEDYGKDAGDFVLRFVSNLIRNSIRRHDSIGRWTGQQFLMILPETDLQGGQIIAEKIRKKISGNSIHYLGNNIYASLTLGISLYSKEMTIETLIENAEKAVKTGKKSGKNCVIVSSN